MTYDLACLFNLTRVDVATVPFFIFFFDLSFSFSLLQGGSYARMILALGVVFQLYDFFFFFFWR